MWRYAPLSGPVLPPNAPPTQNNTDRRGGMCAFPEEDACPLLALHQKLRNRITHSDRMARLHGCGVRNHGRIHSMNERWIQPGRKAALVQMKSKSPVGSDKARVFPVGWKSPTRKADDDNQCRAGSKTTF